MGVKEKRGVVLVDAMFAGAVGELGSSPFMSLRMGGVSRHVGQTSAVTQHTLVVHLPPTGSPSQLA
jgi:hypothetical protein